MARSSGVSKLVKTATHFVAQAPGGERLVLQAVRDLLNEVRALRREGCGESSAMGDFFYPISVIWSADRGAW